MIMAKLFKINSPRFLITLALLSVIATLSVAKPAEAV